MFAVVALTLRSVLATPLLKSSQVSAFVLSPVVDIVTTILTPIARNGG
jgi:hypothetical protein